MRGESTLPGLAVIGTPTKRASILALAAAAEQHGFSSVVSTGVHGNLAMCGSLAHVTTSIPFWTSVQPIYHGHPTEVAIAAAHLHEISGGRFRLGLGVSHARVMDRLGIHPGKPLHDIRAYVSALRESVPVAGALPPIYLATLRDKMLDLALEIADGAVWANASQRYMATQLARVRESTRPDFALATMIPTVIDVDLAAAREVHRRTLAGYVTLPNYRNYWKQAGYAEEMDAIEEALAARDRDRVNALMTDEWLDDCTISGPAEVVRERVDQWRALGVEPILVMSSTSGGQAAAIRELFAAYAR
ncbi:MAG TPA: LLM class flavin-dependent oxidoreductase [Ilumatobacteraceae bacterium]|nr:LLM class flavin-dependent oxidoreductase [Ilumatobacteraceae bacterium]